MEWTPPWLRMTGFYAQNRQEIKQPRRKPKHQGAGRTHSCASQAARLCVHHHGLLVVVFGLTIPSFFEHSILVLFALLCGFLPWIIRLGSIGLVLQPSLLHLASTSFFSLLLGSIYVNMKSKTPNKPNERNRRNRGINHKIKHINP